MNVHALLVIWKIRCLNCQSKTFFDRYLVLDWPKLTPEQHVHIRELIADRATKPAIRRYRWAFQEVELKDLNSLRSPTQGFTSVWLEDYYEDEAGKPMNEIGLAQQLTGQEFPILLGNPASVLRLGPTNISRKDQWDSKAANAIAHFLQTARQIAASPWLKSPLYFEYGSHDLKKPDAFPAIDTILNFKGPNGEATRGMLMSIRLLISSDNIFNIACNWYLKHTGDQRKKTWVQQHQGRFNKSRQSTTFPFGISDLTNQKIIDIFMYGSGFVHRNSSSGSEAELAKMLKQHGKERFLTAFHSACHTVCEPAFTVYHIIKQDYDHWIQAEGCQPPDRIDMNALLG